MKPLGKGENFVVVVLWMTYFLIESISLLDLSLLCMIQSTGDVCLLPTKLGVI